MKSFLLGVIVSVCLTILPWSHSGHSIKYINFLLLVGSFPCLFGQHGSSSTAKRPVELSENILPNIFNKYAAPDCTKHVTTIVNLIL